MDRAKRNYFSFIIGSCRLASSFGSELVPNINKNEFVTNDKNAMESLKNALINSKDAEIYLRLGELDVSIRFVESHFLDIKTILSGQKIGNENLG